MTAISPKPAPPLRVLQLISSCDFLGAERVVSEIARQSDPAHCAVAVGVIAPDHTVPERMAREIDRTDVPVICLPGERRFDRACLRAIQGLIDSRQIQVLHSHNYKSDFYALAARYLGRPGVRLVASSHTWKLTARSEHVYKFLDLKMLRAFDAVVAISTPIRDEILAAAIRPERVTVIDNGIDLASLGTATRSESRRMIACTEEDWVVGCVASLTPEKGHLDLLAGVRDATHEIPRLRVILVGDGPERPGIESFVREHKLEPRVQLLGARTDVRTLYPAFDAFALASQAEGLPMVVLEAMASGVPVIATTVGALPRVIESGQNGLLVPPGSPAAMRDALVTLYRDPVLRQSLAQNARSTAERTFSSRRMTKNYEALYRSLVE